MNKSVWIALGVFAVVVLWMLTGLFFGSDEETLPAGTAADGETSFRVRVVEQEAREVAREVFVSARTQADRAVVLRAEIDGRVEETPAERGAYLTAGTPIVVLDRRDRRSRFQQAEALVRQRELEFQAAEDLAARGLQSENLVAEAAAALEAARAERERAEIDLDSTTVRAPFDGFLRERMVETGDYVSVASEVASFYDLDPLVIAGEVSEREVDRLELGQSARIELAGGRRITGTVRYISPVADEDSRTFTVEVEVPNPDGLIAGGLTARVFIETDRLRAHFVSPAVLALDDAGVPGIKVVDGEGTVRFIEAEPVKSEPEGLWVTGLPETARIITVGQGFVQAGEKVEAVPAQENPITVPAPEDGEEPAATAQAR